LPSPPVAFAINIEACPTQIAGGVITLSARGGLTSTCCTPG